jgi:hypothetical protein
MSNNASITNVINVALIPEGQQAQRDNMNTVAVLTSETGVIFSAERFRSYRDAAAVEADWGTASVTTQYAQAVFGTKPNPINFGGELIIGLHRAVTENVPATAATLLSTQLAETTIVSQLQTITDGSFNITVDAAPVVAASLDFSAITTLDEVAAILDTAIAGATVSHNNGYLTITSATTGVLSLLTYMTPGPAGTFIGALLTMSNGSGGTLTQGAAAVVLPIETKVESLSTLKALVNFKGHVFTDATLDAEVPLVAAWDKANQTIGYTVFSGSAYLAVSVANPVWVVKLSSQSNFRCLYSKAGNRLMAATYMARTHTVNFNAENSAMTMNLKELSVPAESYSQTEIDAIKRVGMDLYTTIKDTPVVLTSGANDFVDNVYNIIAFIDAIQTDMFNVLKATGTKLAQITRDVNKLVATAEKTSRGFVRANVFGPGAWSSPDSFGNIDTFNRNIEQFGFYWLAGLLKDQPQADRQARKSPVLQGAVKNAGAIHSADIIINFNL